MKLPDYSYCARPKELHVLVASERASLVKALSTVALTDRRRKARRFLEGLSTNELRYIASYLGACFLESALQADAESRSQVLWQIAQYECSRADDCDCSAHAEHQMILLIEYLKSCRCPDAVKMAAGSA